MVQEVVRVTLRSGNAGRPFREELEKTVSDFRAGPDDRVMHDLSDNELLRAFGAHGDEQAFAELVRRWGSLVIGAALRRTGNHGMAEEAAQNVFTTLARRAAALASHPALAAWLQKAAMYEAARALEKETNRRRIMHAYSLEPSAVNDIDVTWQETLPLLAEALAALPEPDRQVILQRYWQSLSFKKIAAVAGSSVAACEKRAERALGKLSALLRRRGATISAVALAAGLAPALSTATAAPAVLARLTSASLAAAKAAPASGFLTSLLLMKSKLTPAAILAALIALCATGGWVAGRSSVRTGAPAGDSASLTSGTAAAAPGKASASPAATAQRESLRALLEAAQRDLITANYDPAAKARAAARVAAIAPGDIRAALAFADELVAASGDSSPLAALVLQRWAEFAGPAACEAGHARKLKSFPGLPPLSDPLKAWAARDPQAAFDWYRARASAEELKKDETQRWGAISSLRWVMGAWALRDMDAAVRAFSSLTNKDEISGAMIGFSEMSGTAPGRTAILDAFLAKSAGNSNVWSDFHDITNRWSAHQPAELAAWLDTCGVPQSSHDSMAKPILTGWLREDAQAAMKWWFQAPGGYPEREHRMGTLIEAWTDADVFAAAEWLAAQPLDATAAQSMSTLSCKVARSDPERGFAWALSIPGEHYRNDALRQVVTTWAATDKPAATAAINAAALDDARKTELLKAITAP